MEPLKLPVTMLPGTRRADGSVSLKQVTMRELTTEQFAHVDEYRGVNGWLLFAPNQEQIGQVPTESATGRFTPSQELRFELLRLHMKKGGNKDNFQPFYERSMTQIIATIAGQIDSV